MALEEQLVIAMMDGNTGELSGVIDDV